MATQHARVRAPRLRGHYLFEYGLKRALEVRWIRKRRAVGAAVMVMMLRLERGCASGLRGRLEVFGEFLEERLGGRAQLTGDLRGELFELGGVALREGVQLREELAHLR